MLLIQAHIPLKNPETKMFQALSKLKTPLRIGLTGTPMSNNLLEYHSMMSFIRPGTLGNRSKFETEYVDIICRGLSKDCSKTHKTLSDKKSAELYALLKPFVNRKDASILLRDLPPLQQVVLHLGPR